MVATCFANCPKNDWLFATSQDQLANPPTRRTLLRLTLARTPSAALRSTLRLLHLVRRVSSVRIPSQERSHFGGIESWDCGRWRSSAFRGCSSIAGFAALGGALRPEVA